MCAAGWLDQARVAYPTTYSNPLCGFGHVGIVDYGIRKNLSETWDTFCYRMKGEEASFFFSFFYCDVLIRQVLFLEVKCDCSSGFIGDGFSCTGNLLQVLQETPSFSNFLTVSYLLSSGELRKHFTLFRVTRLQDVNDGRVSAGSGP